MELNNINLDLIINYAMIVGAIILVIAIIRSILPLLTYGELKKQNKLLEQISKDISYIKDNQSKNKLIFSRSNYVDKIKDKDLNLEEKRDILGMIGELSDTDKKSLIEEVLTSVNYNFIVTPKEVDFVIDKLSMIIGDGINKCLHDI